MEKTKTTTITLLALMILSAFAVLPAYASSPTFTATATPTKSTFYIGEDAGINFELEWMYLTQNYTVNMELWNSTEKVTDLETGYVVAGACVGSVDGEGKAVLNLPRRGYSSFVSGFCSIGRCLSRCSCMLLMFWFSRTSSFMVIAAVTSEVGTSSFSASFL